MSAPRGPVQITDPVRFSDPVPESVDVAIIGGGIVGITTALFLARAGVSVWVGEKGRVAGEQSSRNWGWVRQQGRDPAELPIMVEALAHWRALGAEIGPEVSFAQTGVTYLAPDEATLARYEGWLTHARALGIDTRIVSRAELQATLPSMAGWVGALSTPSDGRAEPWTAVPAIAALLQAEGGWVSENCAVRVVDRTAGAVSGVHTERGFIRTSCVLVAGGAWSSLFLRNLGVDLPQLSGRGTVAATMPMAEFWPGAAADERFAFRRRQDGGYTLAPGMASDFWLGPDAFRHFRAFLPQARRDFSWRNLRVWPIGGRPDGWFTRRKWGPDDVTSFEKTRVLNPAPSQRQLDRLHRDFAAAFPDLGTPILHCSWAGMIDATPDQVPVLDESPVKGLFIATGLSGHGFGIGPGIGRVMADLIRGRAVGHDLSRFRLARFTDGSPLVLGPAL